MRRFKMAAIAVGVLIGYLVISTVIGFLIWAALGALAAAAIVLGIKTAFRKNQVSRKSPDRELPRQEALNVDDELARLKREKG
jgi:uncharacterized membrane protein